MDDERTLRREDYEEPLCPLDMTPPDAAPVARVPQQRISEKLDEYMERHEFDAAERHLLYWLEEAKQGRDQRGAFHIYNEMMGMYRKTGRRGEALGAVDHALALLPDLGYETSASGGTCLVNAGTVYSAFSMFEESLACFARARAIYEQELTPSDDRLGGLYNNMGLTLTALGRFAEARELYEKALAVMAQAENGELECAITWLNLADAAEAELGAEAAELQIRDCLDAAESLLWTPGLPRNGYDAFVCEKCAPVFSRYGYFLAAQKLEERARAFHKQDD